MTYRKSHTRFRLVPKSTTWVTLKGYYARCSKTRASFGAHHEKSNADRLYCQRRRCSPVTLHSDNVWFMRTFAGVPWKGGVIQQWVNGKRVFSCFRTLRIRHLRKWGQHYYTVLFSSLSPFHWPPNTWPWMTLNGLKGHFTLYVHYYERPLTNYLLLIYCRWFITRVTNTWPAAKCGKRSIANSDPQSGRVFRIRGKSADLPWTLYIVGTLTNNANCLHFVLFPFVYILKK